MGGTDSPPPPAAQTTCRRRFGDVFPPGRLRGVLDLPSVGAAPPQLNVTVDFEPPSTKKKARLATSCLWATFNAAVRVRRLRTAMLNDIGYVGSSGHAPQYLIHATRLSAVHPHAAPPLGCARFRNAP